MHFKHPEILYFLFLLIIPILIHLFQFQRFNKEAFSNVKFLQQIEIESRKSSVIKKRLILLSRLLALSCLIFAFSQPFIKEYDQNRSWENIIYLDNSLSMQAEGLQGSDLLNEHKNWLIDNLENDEGNYTLISNEQLITNLNLEQFKKSLLDIDFHPIRKNLNQIDLMIRDQDYPVNSSLNIVFISDFKGMGLELPGDSLSNHTEYHFVQTSDREVENISLDSLWISKDNNDEYRIFSSISSQNMSVDEYAISIYVNTEPYGKSSVSLLPGETKTVDFIIPYAEDLRGRISSNDHKIQFDNQLFFSLPKKQKTKVLVIGDSSDYLERIYLPDEFEFQAISPDQLDSGIIIKQALIILNEVERITKPLQLNLVNFAKNQGNLVIIPAANSDIHSYNSLLADLDLGSISKLSPIEKRVTQINYDHPFFNEVFKEKRSNFLYPLVNQSYDGDWSRSSSLLTFDDKTAFISQKRFFDNYVYWISAPLSKANTNFTNSPLIVPILYNFSDHNRLVESSYQIIGHENEFTILSDSLGERALELKLENEAFIPIQQKKADRIIITTREEPLKPGVYNINDKIRSYGTIAYNYDRQESLQTKISSIDSNDLPKNTFFYKSLDQAIKRLNRKHENQSLWQLFIIFVLVFLILETGLQKFLKN